MSLLQKIWVVRDPSPHSALEDICSEMTPNALAQYITGIGVMKFEKEHHAFYSYEDLARADAKARFKIRDKTR